MNGLEVNFASLSRLNALLFPRLMKSRGILKRFSFSLSLGSTLLRERQDQARYE